MKKNVDASTRAHNQLSEPREIRYKDRFDKLSKNFKRFFGDLTNAQIEMLETHSHETLNDSRVRLHNRTLRQKYS